MSRTRVVGYIRVSTEDQAREGVSLEAQRAKLEAYAVAMDLELVAVLEDPGLSAKSLARPGIQAALAMLESGAADGLLVAKLDRLTRSVRDLGTMVEQYFTSRFSLLSVSDSIDTRSAGGRLVLNVLASVAQWEREATAERTRDALRALKAKGVKLGAPSMLECVDPETGERRTDPAKAELVRRVHALHRERGGSLRALAGRLNAEGVPSVRGGRWHASSVRLALGYQPAEGIKRLKTG